MAVGATLLVLRRENTVSREPGWTALTGGALGLVLLAALVAPPLLGRPAQAVLTGSERDVLLPVAPVVVGGTTDLVERRPSRTEGPERRAVAESVSAVMEPEICR